MQRRNITVKKPLLLTRCPLYTPCLVVMHELGFDPFASYLLWHSKQNHITYRAQPLSRPDSWHGLDLQTEQAGTFNYQKMMEDFEMQIEWMIG